MMQRVELRFDMGQACQLPMQLHWAIEDRCTIHYDLYRSTLAREQNMLASIRVSVAEHRNGVLLQVDASLIRRRPRDQYSRIDASVPENWYLR